MSVAECKESKACSPAKHHFDECVERVTGADHGKPVDKKHPEEDCVEECKSP
jgi:ubiquinol-cytochrome c reductase subunit 6